MHKDTSARAYNFVWVELFFFTITVTPNLYPRSVAFFYNNYFICYFLFLLSLLPLTLGQELFFVLFISLSFIFYSRAKLTLGAKLSSCNFVPSCIFVHSCKFVFVQKYLRAILCTHAVLFSCSLVSSCNFVTSCNFVFVQF